MSINKPTLSLFSPYKYSIAEKPKETLLSMTPLSFNSSAIFFAKFIGIANPKFCESAFINVFIPITFHLRQSMVPRYFLGLMMHQFESYYPTTFLTVNQD